MYEDSPTSAPLACTHKHLSESWPAACAGLENDEYVRQIDGYLPTSEVAFVDEIFKANSAILNALLTLLNERLFDNGNQRIRVPLLCLVRPILAHEKLPSSANGQPPMYHCSLTWHRLTQDSALP